MTFGLAAILDTATRANTGPPPSASWTTELSTFGHQIVSNKIIGGTNATNASSWNTTFGPDIEAYITVAALPAGLTGAGLYLRFASNNGYGFDFLNGFGTMRITKMTGGGVSVLTSVSQTVSAGDSIGGSCIGNVLTLYYKSGASAWTQISQTTDSTYTGTGKIMLLSGDSTVSFTNLGGNTLLSGSGGITITAPGLSATGSETITGTGSTTISHPSLLGVGDGLVDGSGAITISHPALAATGSMEIPGSAATTIGHPALAATGAMTINGSGGITIGAPLLAGIFVPSLGSYGVYTSTNTPSSTYQQTNSQLATYTLTEA